MPGQFWHRIIPKLYAVLFFPNRAFLVRTVKTKGYLSRTTTMTVVFKLYQSAQKKWRRLDGPHQMVEIIREVKFVKGERQIERAA